MGGVSGQPMLKVECLQLKICKVRGICGIFGPYLTYCCIVLANPERTTSLEVIYKLKKRAAQIIMYVHYLNHAEPLFRKLNIFKRQILIYVFE